MQENIKQVIVKNTVRKEFKTAPIFQWDTGHVLVFEGFDLPEAFQVHFAFSESGESVPQIGSNDQVTVPDALVEDGRMIYAWLYISTEDAGLTKFVILMPVNRRAKPTHQVPPPVEQSEIDQAIAALNTGVARAETAAENAETAEENASQYAENAYNSSVAAANAAESASGDARAATQKAQEAITAALDADRKAQNASESAQLASQKASEASGYADGLAEAVRTANEAKQTAVSKATESTQSASNAAQKAQEALSSAQAAEGSANDADTAKRGAETAKEAAQGYAGNASASAEAAVVAKNMAVEKAGEAGQSATNAAQSAQAAAQTAAQFEDDITELKSDIEANREGIDELSGAFDEHEEYAENTYAKQDGYYADMTAGNAEQLVSSKLTEDQVPYKLRPAGGTNDIGNREYKEAIVGGTIAWNQLVRDEASDNETDYADVVTVDDAVEDAAGVRVKIEPVQDLHGYDYPWPAGGGKNKLNTTPDAVKPLNTDGTWNGNAYTKNGVTFTVADDGTITVSGTASTTVFFELGNFTTGDTACKFNGFQSSAAFSLVAIIDSTWYGATSGDGRELPANSVARVAIYIATGAAVGNTVIKPMIRLASETDTTFAPYSNICPITGWDGVKVTRTGKNLFDKSVALERGYYAPTTGIIQLQANSWHTDFIPVKGGSTVYANKVNATNTGGTTITFFASWVFWDKDKTYVSGKWNASATSTVPDNACYLTLSISNALSASTIETFLADYMLAYGTSAQAYEPYSGQTYSITLPSEAGTVYGGELTVNADGSGTIVQKMVHYKPNSMSELTLYSDDTTHKLYRTANFMPVAPNFYGGSGAKSSFTNTFGNAPSHGTQLIVQFPYSATQTYLYFRITAETNPLECEFVYELATPQTYTLTASQIRTLLGENNIWADTGDLALTYTGTDEHLTLESGKKYLARISGTDSMLLGSGQEITAAKGADNVFDLTQMFGTAVADYVYGQGASFFRRWFPNARYPYNAGELRHVEGLSAHEMVGFNLWDSSTDNIGKSIAANGDLQNRTNYAASDYIRVLPKTTYYLKNVAPSANARTIYCYDASKNPIRDLGLSGTQNVPASGLITTVDNTHYVRIVRFATTTEYGINLSHSGARNGEYAPYEKHSYPLDSSVVLRGIPKVGANGVYWDGDRYLPDGTVERRCKEVKGQYLFGGPYRNSFGVWCCSFKPSEMPSKASVESAPISDKFISFQNKDYRVMDTDGVINPTVDNWMGIIALTDATSGLSASATIEEVMLAFANYVNAKEPTFVYKLATPTTESAQPYRELQIVDDWGTEEFVTTGLVPVGHTTQYPANLRDKLQHLPDLASSNGIYIVKQTDSEMELLKLPDMPTENGNYRLKLNVASGSPTFSWEVVT